MAISRRGLFGRIGRAIVAAPAAAEAIKAAAAEPLPEVVDWPLAGETFSSGGPYMVSVSCTVAPVLYCDATEAERREWERQSLSEFVKPPRIIG